MEVNFYEVHADFYIKCGTEYVSYFVKHIEEGYIFDYKSEVLDYDIYDTSVEEKVLIASISRQSFDKSISIEKTGCRATITQVYDKISSYRYPTEDEKKGNLFPSNNEKNEDQKDQV